MGEIMVIIKEEELDLDSPIGEKPWPLRLAIPAMIKFIGKIYVVTCTGGASLYILFRLVKEFV